LRRKGRGIGLSAIRTWGSGLIRRKACPMCIDPNIEPVAFALDTKLCHLFPSLGDIHREEIALDLARTAIFMATAMAMDMAQEYRNGGP
ncbi:hypothetical protein, partial [Halomonas sp. ND22Bw]|uniref:hypothetical protein n=1 Tax=Halomonas sp. ND22Bw TaxID=2054178 RepID=UPI001C62D1F0